MHSFGQRANAIITFSLTIVAVICSLASFSDNFNTPSPTAEIDVLRLTLVVQYPGFAFQFLVLWSLIVLKRWRQQVFYLRAMLIIKYGIVKVDNWRYL
ncbi:Signal peptidase complex subunit 3B [Dendrobium catenatum]|uniref:Signal peptidase complex subunit 3B n=1 Tax=Dendrobium catenatum TaxID=906689 RepID=A0A2I0WFI1_9ASPA|nr:Signal peptidase complex subunit 3B [Dendrobium catenatum]